MGHEEGDVSNLINDISNITILDENQASINKKTTTSQGELVTIEQDKFIPYIKLYSEFPNDGNEGTIGVKIYEYGTTTKKFFKSYKIHFKRISAYYL